MISGQRGPSWTFIYAVGGAEFAFWIDAFAIRGFAGYLLAFPGHGYVMALVGLAIGLPIGWILDTTLRGWDTHGVRTVLLWCIVVIGALSLCVGDSFVAVRE